MFAALHQSFANHSYAVHDAFIDPRMLRCWRRLAQQRQPQLHEAATGRGDHMAVRSAIRSDRIGWLDPSDPDPTVQALQAQFERLRQSLNKSLLLGLFELELHLAHYPIGARYAAHVDRFHDDDARMVSVVLYLNETWAAADGGALRLYHGRTQVHGYEDIIPIGGRLVLFLSEAFLHEVLPARRDRWSVTGWFRRRA